MRRHLTRRQYLDREAYLKRRDRENRKAWFTLHNAAIEFANRMVSKHGGNFIHYYDHHMEYGGP